MSLHTIVQGGIAGRRHLRRSITGAAIQHPATGVAVRLSGSSMRGLETLLAGTAIVTAILIGLGR